MKRKKIMQTEPNKTRKPGKVITAQIVGDILVLNFWEDKKLKARYCMNTESKEYETYFQEENTWEQRRIEDTWEKYFYNQVYDLKESTAIDSEKDKKKIREALKLGERDDVFYGISMLQWERNSEIREKAKDNKIRRIKELMDKVPELPKDFKEWIFKTAAGMDFAFKDKEKEIWSCSACGSKFSEAKLKRERKKKTVHNEWFACPYCKTKIQAKTKTNKVERITNAMVLQDMDKDRSVARHIDVDIYWDKEGRQIDIQESIRIVLLRNDKKYACKIYYAQSVWRHGGWGIEWGERNPNNRRHNKEYLYPAGVREALDGTVYEAWSGIFMQLAAAGQKLWYNNMMAGWGEKALPGVIEYLFKGRFYRLLEETTERIWPRNGEYYGALVIRGSETVEQIFQIKDRQKINRIRDCNGGEKILEWMQWSDCNGKKIPEETLHWLTEENIKRDDIRFIDDRMSVTQIMNYVKKQQEAGYKGKTVKGVLDQWNDYLNMCTREKKDTEDEMVYRPRELKRRHDEIVEEINKRRILEELKHNKKQREEEARKMREKFPGAEEVLKEIKEKYEYGNEEFFIMVPKKLMEIVTEGQALHHCVGNTDRYFERIMNRETYICFLRRTKEPETPFYTIEVEPGGTIRQHRSYLDEEPNIEEIRGFLREWQKEIKKRLNSRDKKYAEISKRKREENIEELKRNNNLRVLNGLKEDFMEAI